MNNYFKTALNSPLALFLYNRPNHAMHAVEALKKCAENVASDLFIFVDGPKQNATQEDLQKIAEVSAFAHKVTGFKTVQITKQTRNIGLANSILQGVSKVLQNYDTVIVIEDDIIVGEDFLNFLNLALNKYLHDPLVAGVSGYSFPISENQPYFSRTGSCWGWGTYKRVWEPFIKSKDQLSISNLKENDLGLFNVYGNFYQKMFEQHQQGLLQSWAVVFYLYYFSNEQYFLFSGANLIDNTGFDGSGSHRKKGNFLTDHNPIKRPLNNQFPNQIKENKEVRNKIVKLFQKGLSKPGIFRQMLHRFKSKLVKNI